MTRFEVAIDHGDGDPYWQEISALSEEAAAEKYADDYDCQGDYDIVRAGFRRYHVFGETIARYYARLIP